jgi:cytoskeletal protein RodZ
MAMAINRNLHVVRDSIESRDEEPWRIHLAQAAGETETRARNASRRKLWVLATLASVCVVIGLVLILANQQHTTQRVVSMVTSTVQRAAERVRQTAKELRETALGTPVQTKSVAVSHIAPRRSRASVARNESEEAQAPAESALPKLPFRVWAQDSHHQFLLQPVSNSYLVNVEQGTIYRIPLSGDPVPISSNDTVPSY